MFSYTKVFKDRNAYLNDQRPAPRPGGGGDRHPEFWKNSKGMKLTAPWKSVSATKNEFYHRSMAVSTACFNHSHVIW